MHFERFGASAEGLIREDCDARVGLDDMFVRAALVGLVVVIAGCAGAEPAAGGPSSVSPAASAEAGGDVGSIKGLVVDEEQAPVAKAAVTLSEVGATTTTDDGGRFTFNDLAPLTYSLFVERLGFESVARKIDVKAGAVTDATVVLKAIAVGDEAYYLPLKKTSLIHADNIYLSDCLSNCGAYVNNSNVNNVRCDPCQFVLHLPLNPEMALTEAMWPPSGNPLVNPDMCYYYYKDWSESSAGTFVHHWCLVSRGGYAWPAGEFKNLKGETALKMYVFGATEGVSFEHRIDTWTTFSYGGDLPEDYSALPPG